MSSDLIQREASLSARIVSWLLVAVFCFQLGLTLLATGVKIKSSCPDERNWSLIVSDANHGAVREISGKSHEAEIWACPGSVHGLITAPNQPLALPAAGAATAPEQFWGVVAAQSGMAIEFCSSPLLPPPEARA